VDRAGDPLFTCARFTGEENGGIRWRYLGYAREHCLEGGRGTHNLLKHENVIDFLVKNQVFMLKAVLRALNFFEGLFQFGSGASDFVVGTRVF
jgi:hypothetical protein